MSSVIGPTQHIRLFQKNFGRRERPVPFCSVSNSRKAITVGPQRTISHYSVSLATAKRAWITAIGFKPPSGRVAKMAGLSTYHFARMFKASTGRPPHAYQRQLRCDRAKEFLVGTDLSVTEIAGKVGYATPQAFARMYKVETGTTPTAWRRERRS